MKKFSIEILGCLDIRYNHYLSIEFIEERFGGYYFKGEYPLRYQSRKFDKPTWKLIDGTCVWRLDDYCHRVGKPAWICSDGKVYYWENGNMLRMERK